MRANFDLLVRCFAAVQVPVVLRRPVQFIVMSVTAVTLPIFRGVCVTALYREAPFIVTEKRSSLSGSLSGVTTVTRVTVVCGLFL
jgi:hypothetical protein